VTGEFVPCRSSSCSTSPTYTSQPAWLRSDEAYPCVILPGGRHGQSGFSFRLPHSVLGLGFQRARDRGHIHFRRSGSPQNARALGNRCSGREYVVNDHDLASIYFAWFCDHKRTADVLSTLMPGQTDLRFRLAATLQQSRAQLESAACRIQFRGSTSDQFGLVESALMQLSRMQGHRHNQNFFFCGKKWLQTFDCFGEHASQNISGRSNLVVFEQMNQFAQTAVIAPISRGLHIRRFETAAQSTANLNGFRGMSWRRARFSGECEWAYQPLSTDGTKPAGDRPNFAKTVFTNRQSRNVNQGSTAETAIRGEQRGKEACGDAASPRDPWIIVRNNPGPGGPNWGPVTAEDDPPSPSRCFGGSGRTNLLQYSGARGWKQRGYQGG